MDALIYAALFWVMIASEPITAEAWREVPDESIIGVTREAVPHLQALSGVAGADR